LRPPASSLIPPRRKQRGILSGFREAITGGLAVAGAYFFFLPYIARDSLQRPFSDLSLQQDLTVERSLV
jgi:hypothetical protein